MKDTFGGTIMIYILIFFLGIYIVFIALTLRYAQSFKLKNKVVDWIEQYNGDFSSLEGSDGIITNYLKGNSLNPGVLYIDKVDNKDLKNTCYYVVTSYINWEWPFFGISGSWDIKGETKNVENCNKNSYDFSY